MPVPTLANPIATPALSQSVCQSVRLATTTFFTIYSVLRVPQGSNVIARSESVVTGTLCRTDSLDQSRFISRHGRLIVNKHDKSNVVWTGDVIIVVCGRE